MESRPKLLSIKRLKDFWSFCCKLDEEDQGRLREELVPVDKYWNTISQIQGYLKLHLHESDDDAEQYNENLVILKRLGDQKKELEQKVVLLGISITLTAEHIRLLDDWGAQGAYEDLAGELVKLRRDRRAATIAVASQKKWVDEHGGGESDDEERASLKRKKEQALARLSLTRIHMEELSEFIRKP